MRQITFIAWSLVVVSILTAFLNFSIEVMSYVTDYENFNDTLLVASKTAMHETALAGLQAQSSQDSPSDYNSRLQAAQGKYGVALVQDGLISVTAATAVNGSGRQGYIPDPNTSYGSFLGTALNGLIPELRMINHAPVYSPSDVHIQTQVSDNAIPTPNGVTSNTFIKVTATMQYKPRLPITKFLLDFTNQNLYLKSTQEPVLYTEP